MDVNNWTVTGRLTRPPKDLSNDERKLAILSLANNYRDKEGGEWVDKVLYIDAPVFGKMAENCVKYLDKGSRVLIVGRANVRSWEKDGKSGHTMTILANELLFLDQKKKSAADSGEAPF